MIKAGIIGATGYAGQELMRLLMQHPDCEVEMISSRTYKDTNYDKVYGNFLNITSDKLVDIEMEEMAKKVDVLFIALPHGIASKKVSADILKNTKVIDLGADYRLNSKEIYEEWYGVSHESEDLIDRAVYGLCELKREEIKKADLIANPGCYTTCSILSLMPLVKDELIDKNSIIVDAKSGVTGAGRALNLGTHFTECNDSIKAYKIASHRHTPEIEQELSLVTDNQISISFTPHLIPMNRGILITGYASLKKKCTYKDIKDVYEKYYEDERFIRLLPEGVFPETKWVKGSNYIDINFQIDERTNRIIVLGAIDNLIKGAAGQAVQNMNLLFGLEESKGLEMIPAFPI